MDKPKLSNKKTVVDKAHSSGVSVLDELSRKISGNCKSRHVLYHTSNPTIHPRIVCEITASYVVSCHYQFNIFCHVHFIVPYACMTVHCRTHHHVCHPTSSTSADSHNVSDCICLSQKFNETAQTIQLVDKHNFTGHVGGAIADKVNKTEGIVGGIIHKPGEIVQDCMYRKLSTHIGRRRRLAHRRNSGASIEQRKCHRYSG